MTTVILRKGLSQARLNAALETKKTLTDYANVVVVDPGGNGDYTTQAAAAAAITDDDASHVYNVFVFGEVVNLATWAGRPYIKVHGHECKVYVALLTQTGTSAPTATVLRNEIGNIAWTRTNTGLYTATLTGAFVVNKTVAFCGGIGTSALAVPKIVKIARIDANTMRVTTGYFGDTTTDPGAEDGLLSATPVEIRVYP